MKDQARPTSVDGDAAITELVRLGLAEMVWTDHGAGYRIVEHPAMNAALRGRQRAPRA